MVACGLYPRILILSPRATAARQGERAALLLAGGLKATQAGSEKYSLYPIPLNVIPPVSLVFPGVQNFTPRYGEMVASQELSPQKPIAATPPCGGPFQVLTRFVAGSHIDSRPLRSHWQDDCQKD